MLYPTATLHLLPENTSQPAITPTTVIIHTAVDGPGDTPLWKYFGRADIGVESHFYITRGGVVVQMIDTERRADANYKANAFAVSIEIEDDGQPDNPMNAAQLAAIGPLLRWLRDTHRIRALTPSAWNAGGFGYHSQFPEWSNVKGKTCPGAGKIHQFKTKLLPDLMSLAGEEPEMNDLPNLTNAQFVTHSYRTILSREPDAGGQAFWTGKLDRKEITRNDVRFEFLLVLIGGVNAKLAAMTAVPGNPAFPAAAFEKFMVELEALAKASRS